jgi:UDP-N-acetylglucosamine 2-epimerase (non-hydrolysing)
MKIISLVGARPNFIKEIMLHKEFQKKKVREILVHSGQHYDLNMSDIFFKSLQIKKPDYFLNIGSGNHGEMTGKIMIAFEKVVMKEKPDVILVYGDTNTTLAGALVGAKLKIPIAHIEAGIRSLPKDAPEEINRVVTDHVSDYLFCPSKLAVENLKKEGIIEGVYFVGDVMFDLYKKMEWHFQYGLLRKYHLTENNYIVVTLHRDFNVDDKKKLKKILGELQKINKKMKVVFPIHPRTAKRIREFNLKKYINSLLVIEPIDYLDLMGLVKKSWKVITDSGGLQKETYFAKKQAIILMLDTGWRELVNAKWNTLTDENNIYNSIFKDTVAFDSCSNIYGNGTSSIKTTNILCAE